MLGTCFDGFYNFCRCFEWFNLQETLETDHL